MNSAKVCSNVSNLQFAVYYDIDFDFPKRADGYFGVTVLCEGV